MLSLCSSLILANDESINTEGLKKNVSGWGEWRSNSGVYRKFESLIFQ